MGGFAGQFGGCFQVELCFDALAMGFDRFDTQVEFLSNLRVEAHAGIDSSRKYEAIGVSESVLPVPRNGRTAPCTTDVLLGWCL